MKIELKGFQSNAAQVLLKYCKRARVEAVDGDLQAIVLSSPTGSGKTVTITQLIEWIYEGEENTEGDREAVFLWLSDSPELNAQSRDKILKQSSVFKESSLIQIEQHFNQETFSSGKIYFLNTQKLGKDSLLTKQADGRDFTIWQTIENTSLHKPQHFYVIIDEAHRGMSEKKKDREQAATIVQRFIKGYPEAGMSPVRLIIGMSATPERFTKLIENNRVLRSHNIDAEHVKDSGLLKDKIVLFYPNEKQPADLSLLEEATRRWGRFITEWKAYGKSQGMEHLVKPVLVIQVEDGSEQKLTHTNLEEIVRVVERVAGELSEDSWAHAFQEDKPIIAGGKTIRKVEASKIESDPNVKVVLFKMSLTTGWDCPRAEVMMSFRKAKDHTLIAQLVGRMVRTPLARSIEGQEFLNTVSLYLPHYDKQGLDAIMDKLNNPDPETGLGVSVEDGRKLVMVSRDPRKKDAFDILETLPSYKIERLSKASNIRRLLKLARQLTFDEIAPDSLTMAKHCVVRSLTNQLTRLSRNKDFVGNLSENQEIQVREVWVEYGEWKDLDQSKTVQVKATPENIEDLFEQCGRKLGEGLHMEFWKARKDKGNPYRAKLELFGILQDKVAWDAIEKTCGDEIQSLFKDFSSRINNLTSARQEVYRRIKRIAKSPEAETLVMPAFLEVKKETPLWEKHLYVDEAGNFGAKLNGWEDEVLKRALEGNAVIGWLRNVPRKPWSLCLPYRMAGEDKPLFPDLLIFRREKNKIVVDILDPHDSGLPDAVEKAKGLADYAHKHSDMFGKIALITFDAKANIKALYLDDESVRDEVKKVTSKPHLDKLFNDLGRESA